MTSHFSALTEAEQERLAILVEECGEVVKAGMKILRHGWESKNPKGGNPETNRQALERELGDISHAVTRMINAGDIKGQGIKARAASKPASMEPYLHHQGKPRIAEGGAA